MEISATLGGRLRYLRRENKLNQAQMAKALGIDQRKISRLENNEGPLDAYVIQKLKDEFNVEADWVMSGEGAMYKKTWEGQQLKDEILNNHKDQKIKELEDIIKLQQEMIQTLQSTNTELRSQCADNTKTIAIFRDALEQIAERK
jgi:transcriptional regulator with XRE-family HTH domain